MIFQWEVTISSFSIQHTVVNVEETLDHGMPHFIQSLNHLETLSRMTTVNGTATNDSSNIIGALNPIM